MPSTRAAWLLGYAGPLVMQIGEGTTGSPGATIGQGGMLASDLLVGEVDQQLLRIQRCRLPLLSPSLSCPPNFTFLHLLNCYLEFLAWFCVRYVHVFALCQQDLHWCLFVSIPDSYYCVVLSLVFCSDACLMLSCCAGREQMYERMRGMDSLIKQKQDQVS